MDAIPVNWWAVIVAAVVKFLLGWAWFSPLAMARPWQAAAGVSDADMKAGLAKAIPIDLIANLVMAYVLARVIGYVGAGTVAEGALVGFLAWIGFVATVTIGATAYEQRPFKLFLINNVYLLVTIVIMGAIIAAWQGAPVDMPVPAA